MTPIITLSASEIITITNDLVQLLEYPDREVVSRITRGESEIEITAYFVGEEEADGYSCDNVFISDAKCINGGTEIGIVESDLVAIERKVAKMLS